MSVPEAITLTQGFGNCLAQGDYDTAQALLTPESQHRYSPQALQPTVEAMIADDAGPIPRAIVMTDCLLTEWQYPARASGDVVWPYVSLEEEDRLEAVSVVVAEQAGKLAIRWLEWGRP